MPRRITIFYSWQSDLPSKDNKNFIASCLEKAAKNLRRKIGSDLSIELSIDRDTIGKPGSPDISKTIFDKITNCNIFVCDVTPINNSKINPQFNGRLTPNPNVLTELGFSIGMLGWNRIICVNNLKYGKNEDLPFDIRGHRISTYNSETPKAKEALVQTLTVALNLIIDKYDEIEKEHNWYPVKQHNYDIFTKINSIMSEEYLIESMDTAVNSLFTTKLFYRRCSQLSDFYNLASNAFLDDELDLLCREYIEALQAFHMHCATYFFSSMKNGSPNVVDYTMNSVEITPEIREEIDSNRFYNAITHPYESESHDECDKRVRKLIESMIQKEDLVKITYKKFITCVKQKGLVRLM
jgi:hypothetical protein